MNLETHLPPYLNEISGYLSLKTVRTQGARLKPVLREGLVDGKPETLLKYLKMKSQSTLNGTFSDVISFYDSLLSVE